MSGAFYTTPCPHCGEPVTNGALGRASHMRKHKREHFAAALADWQAKHGLLTIGRSVTFKSAYGNPVSDYTVAVIRPSHIVLCTPGGGVMHADLSEITPHVEV